MNISANIEAFFRALNDPTRLRSLLLLQSEGELCVCELTFATGLAQPKVSRHLAQLREAGLVRVRRAGQWVHYRINPDLSRWMIEVLETTANGVGHEPPFAADRESLGAMPNRPSSPRCA